MGHQPTNEYYAAVTTFNLSWPELVLLSRASLEHACVPPEVKTELLAASAARVAAFAAAYGSGSPETALAALATIKPVTCGHAKGTWRLSRSP